MENKYYELFKRINARILKYERKVEEANLFVCEFSCMVEDRTFLERVLKQIREDGKKAEIMQIKNAKIYFSMIANKKFFEDFFEKVF